MVITNQKELETIRECGRRLAAVLAEVERAIRPGVSTAALDEIAERLIRETGGDPIFKGYRTLRSEPPFPASLCTSINNEIVHGIPSPERILQEGDIIGLDIGMRWPVSENQRRTTSGKQLFTDIQERGLVTDMAVTVGVGKISEEAVRLLRVTKESLDRGISILKPGVRLGDVGSAVQKYLEENGYGVIRDLAGHGVGIKLHEEPFVPNYGKAGVGPLVLEGMVLALEPMATEGDWHLELAKDGWTFKTRDGKLAAHFEHTVHVGKDRAEILTMI